MNDKIKELAEQAGLMCLYDYGPEEDPHAMVVGQKDLELFAQLIIQECMKVAASQRNPANLNYKPSERFVEDLRQHFGVEQ